MKKFTGRYTTNTAKALKGSERILCQVSEDGTIYVCNGYLLCTMNALEYAATVQPLTCCEPGAWTFDKDGKHEDDAHKLDLVKLFADTVRTAADAEPLARAPFTVQAKKAPAACYYNAAALRGDLYRAANEIDELKNKLAELHETKTEQPAEQKPEPKTAAEIIAARWAEVDGLTATIKGATTAAPVVWLAGDTKPHEKEIEAAGGKWSGKKNAYYFRVA